MIENLIDRLLLHKIVFVDSEHYQPLRDALDIQRVPYIVKWDNSFQRYVFMEE